MTVHIDLAAEQAISREPEIRLLVSGAANLRSRGHHEAAERMEAAALRLWVIRSEVVAAAGLRYPPLDEVATSTS